MWQTRADGITGRPASGRIERCVATDDVELQVRVMVGNRGKSVRQFEDAFSQLDSADVTDRTRHPCLQGAPH